jgi:formate dehydrogenase subunit gamma
MKQEIQNALAKYQNVPGALLPILHEVQDALGYVPPEAVGDIAKALNLSRAEVHGVITYYHHFRSESPGRHIVQVCCAEACQAMGAQALIDHAEASLGCSSHGTTADGRVTLEPAYCLGLCACSPAIMIDDVVHARVTNAKFDALMGALPLTQEKVSS